MNNFTLNKNNTFKAPVTVTCPGGEDQEFSATFLEVDLSDLHDQLKDSEHPDTTYIETVLIGIEGIVDQNGKSVKFDKDVVQMLAKKPYVATAVIETYMTHMTGKARIKN